MEKKEPLTILIILSLLFSFLALSLHAFSIYAIQEALAVTVTIDADAPHLVLLSPENKTYENSVTISYIAIDSNLDSVWYNLTGNNFSLIAIITGTISLPLDPGPYQLILYANDTFGHTNSTGVNFSVIQESSQPIPEGGVPGSPVAPAPPRNISNRTSPNQTSEKFLRLYIKLLNPSELLLQLLIESSSTSPLIIDYEIIADKVIYHETETIPFTTLKEKKLSASLQNLRTGTYIIQATVRQSDLEAYDQESFRIEIETPLKIKKHPSLLPLILAILLLLTYLAILKLQLEKMKEKKSKGRKR